MSDPIDRIRHFIRDRQDEPRDFADDEDLIEGGLVDSLQFVDFVLLVSELCGREIPLDDIDIERFPHDRRDPRGLFRAGGDGGAVSAAGAAAAAGAGKAYAEDYRGGRDVRPRRARRHGRGDRRLRRPLRSAALPSLRGGGRGLVLRRPRRQRLAHRRDLDGPLCPHAARRRAGGGLARARDPALARPRCARGTGSSAAARWARSCRARSARTSRPSRRRAA